MGMVSLAPRASASACSTLRPKRPAMRTIVSPVPDEHLSLLDGLHPPGAIAREHAVAARADADEVERAAELGQALDGGRQAGVLGESADDRRPQLVGVQAGGAERVAVRDARLAIPGGEHFGRPAVVRGAVPGLDANPIAVDRENHQLGRGLAEITTRHPDRALHRLSHRRTPCAAGGRGNDGANDG